MFVVERCGLVTLFFFFEGEKKLLVPMLGLVQPLDICFFVGASVKTSLKAPGAKDPKIALPKWCHFWMHKTRNKVPSSKISKMMMFRGTNWHQIGCKSPAFRGCAPCVFWHPRKAIRRLARPNTCRTELTLNLWKTSGKTEGPCTQDHLSSISTARSFFSCLHLALDVPHSLCRLSEIQDDANTAWKQLLPPVDGTRVACGWNLFHCRTTKPSGPKHWGFFEIQHVLAGELWEQNTCHVELFNEIIKYICRYMAIIHTHISSYFNRIICECQNISNNYPIFFWLWYKDHFNTKRPHAKFGNVRSKSLPQTPAGNSHKVSSSGSVGLTDSPFQAIRQLHQMRHLWPETQMRPNQKPSLLWWLQHLKCVGCRNPRLRFVGCCDRSQTPKPRCKNTATITGHGTACQNGKPRWKVKKQITSYLHCFFERICKEASGILIILLECSVS